MSEQRWDDLPDAQERREQRRQQRRASERNRKKTARQNMTPEQHELQRVINKARMKIARLNATPEQRAKERIRERNRSRRSRAARTLNSDQCERRRETARQRSKNRVKPFWGVDSEGAGKDDKGRQNCVLIAASGPGADEHRMKHRDGAPLSVKDRLEFILSLPRNAILIGFAFGYDANMILNGIRNPEVKDRNGKVVRDRYATLRRIIRPPKGRHGLPLSTFWGEYAITWQSWQFFKVSRIDRTGGKARANTYTTRIVYDVFGFFGSSFVKTIEKWNVCKKEELAFIERMKNMREEFDALTPEIIDYCKFECRLLARVMSAFREVCIAADVVPERWCGAGWIAAKLLEKHGIPQRPLTAKEVASGKAGGGKRRPERDLQFERAANLSYYGGRSEVSHIGHIPVPVWEYDLKSAYPAATLELPCSMHTRWVHQPKARRLPKSGPYLAKITFEHLSGIPWCGLPFRRKNRALYWPYQGTGWYWSYEIEAAQRRLFAKVTVRDLWAPERTCDCHQYGWMTGVYEQRKKFGSYTQGEPLKIGMSSVYGKHAQRCGSGPYHDVVAAGLITAITRARLIKAISHDPGAVIMASTDAVYTTRPLPLDIGDALGQWELKNTWPDLFIAQPGVYWSPTRLAEAAKESPDKVAELVKETMKSRGAPRSVIGDAALLFVRKWDNWIAKARKANEAADLAAMLADRKSIPKVRVTIDRVFHGCKLMLRRKKPWLAGTWKKVSRDISFDWSGKRSSVYGVRLADDGANSLVTMPIQQLKHDESVGYEPIDFDKEEGDNEIDIITEDGETETISEEELFEAMPDHVQWLPHE